MCLAHLSCQPMGSTARCCLCERGCHVDGGPPCTHFIARVDQTRERKYSAIFRLPTTLNCCSFLCLWRACVVGCTALYAPTPPAWRVEPAPAHGSERSSPKASRNASFNAQHTLYFATPTYISIMHFMMGAMHPPDHLIAGCFAAGTPSMPVVAAWRPQAAVGATSATVFYGTAQKAISIL